MNFDTLFGQSVTCSGAHTGTAPRLVRLHFRQDDGRGVFLYTILRFIKFGRMFGT